MAADEQPVVASGANMGEGLRRRNVPGQAPVSQGSYEVDDKKKRAARQDVSY